MLNEVKDCPCCGGYAEIFEDDSSNTVYVQCTECGLQTSKYPIDTSVDGLNGEQWALMRWNGRSYNNA